MMEPPHPLEELAAAEEAITMVYNAAHYVGMVAYSEGEEFLFKNALVFELQERFRVWSEQTGKQSPVIETEYILAYPFPVSSGSSRPACTHMRIDVYIHGSVDFPSMVIELKAVDKVTVKHCKQAHHYFALLQTLQLPSTWTPQWAMVINFRSHFLKEEGGVASAALTRKRKKVDSPEAAAAEEEDPVFATTTAHIFPPSSLTTTLRPRIRGPYPDDPPMQCLVGKPGEATTMKWFRLTTSE
jgi:hypothetical protein